MKARLKRVAAWLLCGCMLTTILPGALAETGASDDAPVIPGYTQDTGAAPDTNPSYIDETVESADAVYAPGAPSGGTTAEQPFPAGTGGSTYFRIPALVTLRDGTLVAAADARWNHAGDACALDTMVSTSADGGKTWNYSFPNFFNDSVNAKQSRATAFIDPLVVVGKDNAIYMLVDLFPGGIGLNTAPSAPAASTGYVEIEGEQRLAIYGSTSGQTDANYTHYVGDFENDGYAPVIYALGETPTAYYVDDHYNLYSAEKQKLYCQQLGAEENTLVQQNVFFYNADLHVRNATYLWLVKSTDGGATWSAPNILNPQIRKTTGTNQFYGVGPGAGLCLDDGTIVMPCYTFTSGQPSSAQIASFIYSSDGGVTWERSDDATSDSHWSSESALVQLDTDTIRHFYRDGYATLYYTDHSWDETQSKWVAGAPVDTEVTKTYNNQLAAIRYSEPVDGKPAILVSTAASGTGAREHGKIYTFTLNDDNSMDLAYTYSITDGSYGYSSLTELNDGTIGLLYEIGASIEYHNFAIGDIADGGVIEGKQKIAVPLYGTRTVTVAGPGPSAEELATVDSAIVTVTTVPAADGTAITYTGLKDGTTSYTSGGITTTISVVAENLVNVALSVGETKAIPVKTDQIEKASDATVATAAIQTDDKRFDVTGVSGNLGTDANYNGAQVPMSNALYHFAGDNTDGFTVSAKTGDGTKVYLKPSGGSAGYPSGLTEATLTLLPGFDENSFYLLDSGARYLHFYRKGKNHFDRVDKTTDFQSECSFLLYRPALAGETSSTEIPGYVHVTALDSVVGGGYYLIVAQVGNNYFALYPSTSTGSKFAHVVKADATSAQTTNVAGDISHSLTLTGKSWGTTDVMVDGIIYRVAVTSPSYDDGGSTGSTGSTTDKGTVTNPDGSTTTTVTDKTTGTVTETTKGTDGTVTVVETKKDGSVAASEKRPDGTQGTTTITAGGVVSAQANVSEQAIKTASEAGKAIILPVTGVKNTADSAASPVVKVTLPKTASSVKVEIPVEKVTPGTVLVLVKADGSEEIVKSTAFTATGVTVILDGSVTLKVMDNSKSFADVAAVERWAGDAITFVSARGLFGGVGGEQFAPTEIMDRAMLVTVLHRLENEPDSTGTLGGFSDGGAAPAWSVDAMTWGVEAGIITGNGAALQPSGAISREQLVTILYRYAGATDRADGGLNAYADAAQVSGWAQDAMQWAVTMGLVTGKDGGTLDPTATATRAEVATILMRFINLK